MKSFDIRRTTVADLPALRQILDRIELFPSELLDDMIAPALAGETEDLWLTCLADGHPVGFCFTAREEMTDRTWNLLAIGVLPDRQRRGIGAALVRAVETELRQQEQRLLLIDTSGRPEFKGVHRFYKALRYAQTARIPDFWATGDDKVVFCKGLL